MVVVEILQNLRHDRLSRKVNGQREFAAVTAVNTAFRNFPEYFVFLDWAGSTVSELRFRCQHRTTGISMFVRVTSDGARLKAFAIGPKDRPKFALLRNLCHRLCLPVGTRKFKPVVAR